MQVAAYLDKDTGSIYGTEQELIDAQAERALQAAAVAARVAARAASLDASTLLVRELTDVSLLPELFNRMLEAWMEDEYHTMLGRKKRLPKGYVKPALYALKVSQVLVRGSSTITLRLRLAVTISGSVGATWSPDYAFAPFSYAGGSSQRTVQPDASLPAMELFESDFQCDIPKLPAFQQVVKQYSSLMAKQAVHDREVGAQAEVAMGANAQYAELEEAARAASQVCAEARAAYLAAESAREDYEARLKADAMTASPFALSTELKKHCAAVGDVTDTALAYMGIYL